MKNMIIMLMELYKHQYAMEQDVKKELKTLTKHFIIME